MKAPLFTIITVCYNAREALPRTLESVEQQNCSALEHLIIDGQSTDGSLAFLQEWASARPYVRVVSEPDEGIYDAMNKGATLAQGEWLCFMNAGDTFFAADTLKQIKEKLLPEVDVLYGDHEVVHQTYREVVQAQRVDTPWVSVRYCHQSAFYRKKCFADFQYSGKYITSDFEHAFALYRAGFRFVHLPQTVASFWHDGLNTQHKIRLRYEILEIVRPHDRRIKTLLLLWKNILWTQVVEGLRRSLPTSFFEALSKLKTRFFGGGKKVSG